MGITTKIEWAGSTASPWYGCTKVSPGCANCYAESWAKRGKKDIWGKGKPRQKSKSFERDCRKLNKEVSLEIADARAELETLGPSYGWDSSYLRPKVFPSLCDWLDPEVPSAWLNEMLKVIQGCRNLDFLLLTKRPELYAERIQQAVWDDKDGTAAAHILLHGLPSNVWVGASCEDQERYWERQGELVNIPAAKRFLSLEPLLGPIDMELRHGCRLCNHPGNIIVAYNGRGVCSRCNGTGHEPSGIDWVIVGGESGPKARPCNIEWIRDIVRQCKEAAVPCFVKQLGSRSTDGSTEAKLLDAIGMNLFKHTKGGDISEWPADLKVRETI